MSSATSPTDPPADCMSSSDDPAEPAEILAYRRERGFVAELASPDECMRLIPGLTPEIKGGVRSPRHGQVDPFLTMAALAAAARRAGAELLPDTRVDAITMDGDQSVTAEFVPIGRASIRECTARGMDYSIGLYLPGRSTPDL